MINKKNAPCFTPYDEKVFSDYLQFCGIGLRNAQLYEKSQLEVKRNQVRNFLFIYFYFFIIGLDHDRITALIDCTLLYYATYEYRGVYRFCGLWYAIIRITVNSITLLFNIFVHQVLLDLARMIFEEQSTIEHMVFRILTHTQSLIQCQRVQVNERTFVISFHSCRCVFVFWRKSLAHMVLKFDPKSNDSKAHKTLFLFKIIM